MRAYTTDQVAEILQLSSRTVRSLIEANELEAFRIGGSVRITEAALQKAMGITA